LEKFSADRFLGKPISQPKRGYRFSVDPFLVSGHIQPLSAKKIVDVGCGCGIIPLILASRHPDLKITGIEIQEQLYRSARQNVITHGLKDNIQIIHEDIKNITPSHINGKADIIVSNPPYKQKNSGRLNPDSQKAIARHEITLDLDTLFKCSSKLLHEKGQLYIIFPAQRLPELILTMAQYKFTPDFIRFVHIKKNTPAKRIILCAVKKPGRDCNIAPPLYIYSSENKFSKEYDGLFKP
jgi:tRNA1(Val) A37 N6-methylase TrmN6